MSGNLFPSSELSFNLHSERNTHRRQRCDVVKWKWINWIRIFLRIRAHHSFRLNHLCRVKNCRRLRAYDSGRHVDIVIPALTKGCVSEESRTRRNTPQTIRMMNAERIATIWIFFRSVLTRVSRIFALSLPVRNSSHKYRSEINRCAKVVFECRRLGAIEKCALCHIHYDVVRRSSSECRKKTFSRNIYGKQKKTTAKCAMIYTRLKWNLFCLRNEARNALRK